jgi:hypothetical protein
VHYLEILKGVPDDGQYRGGTHGVCKGAVCLSIRRAENTLVKDGAFALPGKKRRTLKTQIIIERNSLEIIDVREAKGEPVTKFV